MLLIEIDRRSEVPAYLQIRDAIIGLVDDGSLAPGDRLPPTRTLARSAGVHRSTVVRAYDEIRALGYLESCQGGYTTVRRRARPPAISTAGPRKTQPAPFARPRHGEASGAGLARHQRSAAPPNHPPELIDFDRLAADPRLTPVDDLRRCLRVAATMGTEVFDYAEPAGRRPLRETIASRLRAHGVSLGPEEILITNGAQQAIDLILRLLVDPGDRIVVEAPTYGMLHPLRRLHRAEAVEIPMTSTGMDLDVLAVELGRSRPKMVYTMPNFHNPTGVTTDQAHRERLLELCERHRVPVVEDGFEEEMKYFGRAVLPVKSMDRDGLVFYVGTFSKLVFPGFRVGWIAAPREAVRILCAIQHTSTLSAATIVQAAAEQFCRSGRFEAHLRRIHRVYRRRMQTLVDGLDRALPSSVQWTRPAGGYTLWLTLAQPGNAEAEICADLNDAGVLVTPGRGFYACAPDCAHLRLCIACVDEERIAEGCRRLGSVLSRRDRV